MKLIEVSMHLTACNPCHITNIKGEGIAIFTSASCYAALSVLRKFPKGYQSLNLSNLPSVLPC